MKYIMLVVVLLFTSLVGSDVARAASCGIKPIPPIGCKRDAVCACDQKGHCEWIFTNCR